MKKVLFFYVFLCAYQCFSQSNWQEFKKLSCPHKTWVLFHLCKAKKAFIVSKEAQRVTDSIAKTPLLDGDKAGGQVDAFRHAYWMARLREEIGKNAARKLGKAHEKSNYQKHKKKQLEDGDSPDEVSSKMDLYNNDIGLSLTRKGVPTPKNGLVYRVINAILAGDLKVLKKDSLGGFLTCDGEIITKKELQYKWKNSKCLISSEAQIR